MSEILLILCAVFLATIVQSTSEFGLVMVGLLSLFCPIYVAVVYIVIPGLVINGTLIWRLRRYLSWEHLYPVALGVIC
jgi:hypothetical protein